jgi:hypothetical protein
MSAQALGYIIWLAVALTQTAICVVLWRKNLRQRYPLFFAYNALHVATSIVLFVVALRGDAAQYFLAYWSINAIRVGLGFGVIYELFRTALKPYHALRDLGTMIFLWAGAIMLLVAAMMAMSTSAPNEASRVVAGVLSLERSVRLVQCGLLLFLLLFGTKLGLTLRHRTFGIAMGIGVYAASDLLLTNLRTHYGQDWGATYSLFRSAIWLTACCGTWLFYVVRPEPAPVMLPSMAQARPILQRWNEALAEAAAGYSSAVPRIDTPDPFTSTVEKTVERVLRNGINADR